MKRTGKKLWLLLALAALLALCAVSAFATGEVVLTLPIGESVTATLTDTGLLTFSGNGAIPDYEMGQRPWDHFEPEDEQIVYSVLGSIEGNSFDVVIEEGVTRIGNNTFAYFPAKTFALPSSLTSIGDLAFYHSDALKSVQIQPGLVSIGDRAFYACETLESINLPEGLTSIGVQAFTECMALEEITIPSTITSAPFAFAATDSSRGVLNQVTLSEGLEIVDICMFMGTPIEEITIPNSVKRIGSFACLCNYLTNVRLGTGLQSIGIGAFDKYTKNPNPLLTTFLTCMSEEEFNMLPCGYTVREEDIVQSAFGTSFYNNDFSGWVAVPDPITFDAHVSGEPASENIAATCTAPGYDYLVSTCTLCGREASRETVATYSATGHSYLYPWSWAEDGSSAVLYKYCPACSDVETVEATVTVSTAEDGTKTCFAVATLNGEIMTDTKIIPAPGQSEHEHSFNVTWIWSDDGTLAFAEGACADCDASFLLRAEVSREAQSDGNFLCTASVTYGGQTYTNSKTVQPGETVPVPTPVPGKTSTFRCSMCRTYEAYKGKGFIGLIVSFVHTFVHLAAQIGR